MRPSTALRGTSSAASAAQPSQAGPPSSNTGVRIATPPPANHPRTRGSGRSPSNVRARAEQRLHARFDWYEATLDNADDGRVEAGLALALGGTLQHAKPRQGYGHATAVERDGVTLATVLGGSARPGEVHVSITSDACDEGVPALRRLWPEHRVSRFDSAIDWRADFDLLDRRAVAFADDRRLKHMLMSDSDGGATRYLGSRTSEVMVRLYKKSEQLRALHPEKAKEIPAGIVRAEVQVRPGSPEAKEAAATMEPDDVWGMSKWSAEWARETLALDPERSGGTISRPSDWSRTLYYLGRQYGPQTQDRAAENGAIAVADEVLPALGLPDALALTDEVLRAHGLASLAELLATA